MNTQCNSQKSRKLPQHITRSGTIVSIFDESTTEKSKFRVRYYRLGRRVSKTFRAHSKAVGFANSQATELTNAERPPTPSELLHLRKKACLHDALNEQLLPFGMDYVTGMAALQSLLNLLGQDGLQQFAVFYAPRLARVEPRTVSDALTPFLAAWTKSKQVSEDHIRNLKHCFECFQDRFGEVEMHYIDCGEIEDWLEEQGNALSTRSKWLYGLRKLFNYARDYLKALPQFSTTECDLVQHRKGEIPPPEAYDLNELTRIIGALPDKETHLAVALVLFGHLRQEEVSKLSLRHFGRNASGQIIMIHATDDVVKRRVGESKPRQIPVKPILARILEKLLPATGTLFESRDVYGRVRNITKGVGVEWKRNALRKCCTSYSLAMGEDIQTVCDHSGHTMEVLKKHYWAPVEQKDAVIYWQLPFNADVLATLPSRRPCAAERLAQKLKLNTPVAPIESKGQLSLFPTEVDPPKAS